MDDKSSRSLEQRLAAGDETWFADAYTAYGPEIERFLNKKSALLDSEDILAESFSRLWEGRRKFDASKGTIRQYLFGIAKKIALARLGSPQAQLSLSDLDLHSLLEFREVNRQTSATEVVDCGRSGDPCLAAIDTVLAGFSPVDRRIVRFRLTRQDESYAKELSLELGLTAENIRQRYLRCLRQIKSKVDKMGLSHSRPDSSGKNE